MMGRQCGESFAPRVRYALCFEHVFIREEDVVSEIYWSEQNTHASDYRLNACLSNDRLQSQVYSGAKAVAILQIRRLEVGKKKKICPMHLLLVIPSPSEHASSFCSSMV
jgi:hypothetical protein